MISFRAHEENEQYVNPIHFSKKHKDLSKEANAYKLSETMSYFSLEKES
jgi:hypothetical protein